MPVSLPVDSLGLSRVVVLTGAGISVASGIRPYRGPGGLWNDESLVRFSHVEAFVQDPLAVWDFWWKTREIVLSARPNPAHRSLAGFESRFVSGALPDQPSGRRDRRFSLITQNIDGLHLRAGSRNVIEYHGNVLFTRCSRPTCDLEPYEDASLGDGRIPRCPRCGAPLRPDIVMFGEAIPAHARDGAADVLRDCDLFVAIGTSGTVYPAAGFVSVAKRSGARTLYVNLESIGAGDRMSDFDEELLGRAEELVPRLFGD